jgi:hypothetical protein
MLTVHVPPGASGVVNEQVVPVMLYSAPAFRARDSAVTWREPPPVLVIVTVLVIGARGVGIVNVRVRTPATVDRVPFVAAVKVRVPGVIAVPVNETGVPVPVAPVNATVSVLVKAVPLVVPAAGSNTML